MGWHTPGRKDYTRVKGGCKVVDNHRRLEEGRGNNQVRLRAAHVSARVGRTKMQQTTD
jgi:hypothetical protein